MFINYSPAKLFGAEIAFSQGDAFKGFSLIIEPVTEELLQRMEEVITEARAGMILTAKPQEDEAFDEMGKR